MLVLDKTQLNSDDGLRHAAPFLHPVHLNPLLLSFTPDEYYPSPLPPAPTFPYCFVFFISFRLCCVGFLTLVVTRAPIIQAVAQSGAGQAQEAALHDHRSVRGR